MKELCKGLVIIETRVALEPVDAREHRGRRYWGRVVSEPSPETPPLSQDALWSSIGNRRSFELTRSSLCNALADAGYSSVLECYLPPLLDQRNVRATIAAFARPRVPILSVPALNEQSWERLSEGDRTPRPSKSDGPLRGVLPAAARRLARRLVARLKR